MPDRYLRARERAAVRQPQRERAGHDQGVVMRIDDLVFENLQVRRMMQRQRSAAQRPGYLPKM